ncbi:MAG: primosomal protein N', partial [Clostridia bacterium]|nr:primosomal protein N' [Clostridia bacterium]
VIVLLPEIALTPQTLEIFCSRYGKRVAIIHSGLSEGERLDTYRRIKSGGADVVIGTRSAVFAPLDNLGMIVIDEEQEHTYKSDMNPKYHAKDIARYRSAHQNSLMLLASATPSFDSYYKAKEGKYALVTLKNRYGGAKLPRVSVVDMRKSAAGGVTSPLGNMLCEKLVETKERGNQSILFINRRGYNNFLSCRSCGEAVSCPTCSVSMTYHTYGGSYDRGELRCHWCGRRMPVPTTCPSCQSEHIARMGYGTQRIEQELSELLPTANILRMDTDTTSAKNAYEELLGKFRRREADILLGTQMVTKGHDFPAVTLVGVLLADASLYLDDYRAAERTFAMLTQVIGRAGRAVKEGEAIIQTNNPDNDCIRLACKQDYERFYENEIRLRK